MPKVIANHMDGDETKHTEIAWARVDSVVNLILENERYLQSKRNKELTEKVKSKFNLEDRQAQYYISEAKREIRKIAKGQKIKLFRRAIMDREFLISRTKGVKDTNGKLIEKPDYKLLLEILKDRDKLCGLYVEETKQTGEMTVKNVDMSQFTEYGLEKLKRGEKLEDVLLDPKSLKQNADTNATSGRS